MLNSGNTPKSPFRIAEHPALDFANTLFCEQTDFIPDAETFLNWAQETEGLEQVFKLAAEAKQRGELDAAMQSVREMRGFLWEILPKIQSGEAIHNPEVIRRLNLALRENILHWELKPCADGALTLAANYTGPQSVSAAMSVVIANLLTSIPSQVIRKCENPECSLWFRDTTKRGNRRWCSMAACGNRAKAAAHRLRAKQVQHAELSEA